MDKLIERLAAESTTYVNTKDLRAKAEKAWSGMLERFPKFDATGVDLESLYLRWAVRNSDIHHDKLGKKAVLVETLQPWLDEIPCMCCFGPIDPPKCGKCKLIAALAGIP